MPGHFPYSFNEKTIIYDVKTMQTSTQKQTRNNTNNLNVNIIYSFSNNYVINSFYYYI